MCPCKPKPALFGLIKAQHLHLRLRDRHTQTLQTSGRQKAREKDRLFSGDQQLFLHGDILNTVVPRLSNPTTNAVENKIAALEGGIGALMTSAGQAASMLSVCNIARSGDHIISAVAIYGGTFNLFHKTLRELGTK